MKWYKKNDPHQPPKRLALVKTYGTTRHIHALNLKMMTVKFNTVTLRSRDYFADDGDENTDVDKQRGIS